MMTQFGVGSTPIFMAGGVWYLRDWAHWIDDPAVAPVAFQFGTRPLLTQESPISEAWKRKLVTLKEGDVFLNRFSPTGFYSSAVRNRFLDELQQRTEHQVAYTVEPVGEHVAEFPCRRARPLGLPDAARPRVGAALGRGGFYRGAAPSPSSTLIFVTPPPGV